MSSPAPTASTTTERDEGRAAKLLLIGLTAASVAPLLASRHLPFTDLPEHAAVASAFVHWNDPSFRIAEHYVVAFPKTPYILFHAVAALLAWALGSAEIAVRVLLVLAGIALPAATRALLGAYGVDRRLALFAPVLFWNRALVIGLLPFVTAMPLLVWALAVLVRHTRAPTNGSRVLLGVLATLLFYLHVSSYVVFVATASFLLLHRHGVRRTLREALFVAPSAICVATWVLSGKISASGDHFLNASEVDYSSPHRALFAFPMWLHDVWRSHVDEGCAIVWWASLLAISIASMRAPPARRGDLLPRAIPLACALLVYFLTPHHAGVGVFLNVRLAPLLGLLALPVLRPPPRTWTTRAALAGASIASLVMSLESVRAIRNAEAEEMAGFDELIDRIEPGARVVALNFDKRSAHAQFAPWLYAVAYHRIRKGGVTAYSFVSFDHWPIRYAPGKGPPRKNEIFWATNPCVFRNETDGAYYDYVLVRGDTDPFADEPPGPRFREVGRAAGFTLYAKTNAPPVPPSSTPDRGPCARSKSIRSP